MLEVVLHKGCDRKAVVDELKKFGPVTERMSIRHVIGLEANMANRDQILAITGVREVEDGDEMTEGFDQSHVLSKSLTDGTSSEFALQALGFDPFRIQHDRAFLTTTININTDNDGSGVVIGIADNLMSLAGGEFTGRWDGTTIYNGYAADAIHPHGNWVASVAAGSTYGIAPGATLINARGLNAANAGATSILVNAMDAVGAAHDGSGSQHLCNCSFGGSSASYDAAVLDLADSGCPVICAVGNNSDDLSLVTIRPAESPHAFAVAGCTIDKRRDPRSNFGTPVDVYAGYGPVWALNDAGTFQGVFGTSFACPLVCGAAARLLQGRPKMTSLGEVTTFYDELRGNTVRDMAAPDGAPDGTLRRFQLVLPDSEFTLLRA